MGNKSPATIERLESRLRALEEQGVVIVDPRQTYLDDSVDLQRICPDAVLYPGTRLTGARTFVGPGAKVGCEGPATLENAVLGEKAEVASGYLNGAVLMGNARAGSNAHFREGTLLEEEASTAHAVGLKHTILMSFVTLGSLINFCDALVAGGTSRRDHSEIGSGFIHFNFTVWGKQGDKATPSLIGDVARGVLLRENRIFLGGLSGMVGPQKIGYGSVTAAGQVIRKDVPEKRLVSEATPAIDKAFTPGRVDPAEKRTQANLDYIGNLVALKAWYQEVRLRQIPDGRDCDHLRIVTQEGIKVLDTCIQERIARLKSFLSERGSGDVSVAFQTLPSPLEVGPDRSPYVDWIQSRPEQFGEQATSWLQAIVSSVRLTSNP